MTLGWLPRIRIIYAESSKAIASCICDPEMPFVNYHFVDENNGEPMACQCGYFSSSSEFPLLHHCKDRFIIRLGEGDFISRTAWHSKTKHTENISETIKRAKII